MYNPWDVIDRLNEQALDACERRFLDPDDYDSLDYDEEDDGDG